MKNRGLIVCIFALAMMICVSALTRLHAQKVAIDKPQLVELTKLAEKAKLFEAENTTLIVNNYKLSTQTKELQAQLAKKEEEVKALEKVLRRFNWLFGIAIVAAVLFFLAKVFKPAWL